MNFYFVAGAAATLALFVPVLLLFASRLFKNSSLLALLIYYFITGLYHLMALHILKLPANVQQQAAVFINYLDAPLVLVVLLFFCNSQWKRRLVLMILVLYMAFEIVVALWLGLQSASSVYLLGPGILIILSLSIYFFVHYGKVTIVQGKSLGKTMMLVSFIFSYGCFSIIYYLHYILKTNAVGDVFIIYFLINFISAVFMIIGLYHIVKCACKINELQLTRRELALFFEK